MVRPFDWGLDWSPQDGKTPSGEAPTELDHYVSGVLSDTDEWYRVAPTTEFELRAATDESPALLTYPTPRPTPHRENNTVYAR